MGLDAMWQRFTIASSQLWVWLQYEAGMHPFIFLGAVIVIISAWILYKSEVRSK